MKDDYPKVQWSRFKGASREEQWVIRGGSIVEVLDMRDDLLGKLEEAKEVDDVLEEVADATHTCKICGKQQSFRQGTSQAGKLWKGWFCIDKTHEPTWVK